jgi:hypothetical protein
MFQFAILLVLSLVAQISFGIFSVVEIDYVSKLIYFDLKSCIIKCFHLLMASYVLFFSKVIQKSLENSSKLFEYYI